MDNVAFMSAIAGLAGMALAPRKNVRAGRITYWTGAAVTAISAYFIALPQGWNSALGALAFVGVVSVFVAYAYTPFVSVDGRRISFYSTSTQPYGAGVTTKRSWWRLLLGITVLSLGVVSYVLGEGNPWLAAIAAGGIISAGVAFGYRDALLGDGIASGQRVQLILASAITLSAFLIVYLGAYYLRLRVLSDRQECGRHSGPTDSQNGG